MLSPLHKTINPDFASDTASGQLDLTPFLRTVGAALTVSPTAVQERNEISTPVELLEDSIKKITPENALAPAVFIDGVQAAATLTHRGHRPITLAYTAAGAVSHELQPIDLEESLEVFAAHPDLEWLDSHNCPITITPVGGDVDPMEVEKETVSAISTARENQEFLVAAKLLQQHPDLTVVADGQIARSPQNDRMGGIIKTTNTKLLPDESILFGMPEEFRSPMFLVPATFGGGTKERYSAYVRMRNAASMPWSYGLIRVESYVPELVDKLAASALFFRQHSLTLDPRGDRHVVPVASVEKWLKARIPYYF